MVEAELTAEGKKTKGGIVVGHDEDITFYSEDESKGNSHEADLAQVCARVYKLPQKLYYNKEDQQNSMPWDCDMELQIGDMVWFSVLESRNAVTVVCEGKGYKILPYRDCYCLKRSILVKSEIWYPKDNEGLYLPNLSQRQDFYEEKVIMLNGFVLLEPIFLKNISPLAIENGEIDITRGIIRYAGKPNREYVQEQYFDFPVLENGDLVLFSPKTTPILLERNKYLAQFDGEKPYFVVQRRRISMILSKGN
jgi:hypothetical protein